eukprot:15350652-Ditylum_brightwellii.AAC.1
MIFRSLKDTAVYIGHLTNISPFWISQTQYQEHINLLMEAIAQENMEKDAKYYELFSTNADHTMFEIQLQLGNPNVHHDGKKIEID